MSGDRLGLRSAVALVAVGFAYAIVLGAGIARHGMNEPIVDPILAVMEVLTLVSVLPILGLMTAVRRRATPRRRVFGSTALTLAVAFACVTSTVHSIELMSVRESGGGGGLVWPSVTYAAELLAWDVFLGLALLFAAPVLDGGGAERVARRGMTICGALCLAGAIGPVIGNMKLQLIGVFGYSVVLPVVGVLLVRVFASEGTGCFEA